MATEVTETSETVTTTSVTRSSRSRSSAAGRSPSPGRSRSPSRRRSVSNRSPSPHRYNTRLNRGEGGDGDGGTSGEGCCVRSCVMGGLGSVKRGLVRLLPVVKELVIVVVYLTLAYTATTMCTYGACDLRLPAVPSVGIMYSEGALVESLSYSLLLGVLFSIPIGEVAKGIPTEHGTLSYRLNGPIALAGVLGAIAASCHLDPLYCSVEGSELQRLFAGVLVVLVLAIYMQWRAASLGFAYNVGAVCLVGYVVDKRFSLLNLPALYYSSTVLVFGMLLTSYAVFTTLLRGSTKCATQCASRGLLLIVGTWYLAGTNYTKPDTACFTNTFSLAFIVGLILLQLLLVYKHRECAKACSAVVLLLGVVTGVLVRQGVLYLPASLPCNSLWWTFNLGCVLDALFVLAVAQRTEFFGVKPVEIVRRVVQGDRNPTLCGVDVKFMCVRTSHLCPLVFALVTAHNKYSSGSLPCSVATLLTMTFLLTSTKLICLEKATLSSAEMVDGRCSVRFMVWTLITQPALTLLPLKYVLSAPDGEVKGMSCCYLTYLMCGAFLLGLLLFTFATLQGHYLLTGEAHWTVASLTTLAANGDEKIPVSGVWRWVRYPFLSASLVLTASMVLVTGFEGQLIFLPLAVQLLSCIYSVHSYNSMSPAFYGARPWRDYQEMVRYNVIPGIW